ncbi:MAG: hypothetical protein AAF391_05040 [Bacteroidota bacterium]
MKYFLLPILLFVSSNISAQTIKYQKVDLVEERAQIRVGEFSIHYKAQLTENTYYTHFIVPLWKPSVGIIHDNVLDTIFQVSYDGRFKYAHFYQSELNPEEFIIAGVYGFEDGITYIHFLEFRGSKANYLDKLYLHKKKDHPPFLGGFYGVFPENELLVQKVDDIIELRLSDGEYITIRNGEDVVINGPFIFRFQENKLELISGNMN